MFFSGYSLATLSFIAAFALLIALGLHLADRFLKVLEVIPSPLTTWEAFCRKLVLKLNRQGRGNRVLRLRGRVVAIGLLAAAAFVGIAVSYFLNQFANPALEVTLLSLIFLTLPAKAQKETDDSSSALRWQIETDALRLFFRVLAPLTGWLLLGWMGVFIALTAVALFHATLEVQGEFVQPIRNAARLLLLPAGWLAVGMIFAAAAFTSKGRPLPALRAGLSVMYTPHKAFVFSIAEAIGLALAGPSSPYASIIGNEWLGSGIARIQEADVTRWKFLRTLSQCFLIALFVFLSLIV